MTFFYNFLVFILMCNASYAQQITTIAATVLDKETHQPLEFVNIGFAGKGIGTVSDGNGHFSLTWKDGAIENAQFLEISSIGYETKKIPVTDLEKLTSYKILLYLSPKEYDLDEVLVINEKRGFDKQGSWTYTKQRVGYWMNAEGLGGEIATKINIDKKNTQLHDLTFNIEANKTDSLLVRVNVYDYYRGRPGKNLLTQNIYHTISRKKGVETIPLKDFNIIVHEDIIVSIELVRIYGNAIYFEVSGSPYKGISYTREVSMDGWRMYRNAGIAFNLLTSFPLKDDYKVVVQREQPKAIDVFWDTSLGMQHRDLDEELQLLKNYLRSLENVKVRAVKFSFKNSEERIFQVGNNKEINILLDYLKASNYNGASDFSEVLKETDSKADIVFLFSHGKTIFAPLEPKINIPIFCVNSIQDANHLSLQAASYYSNGHYINLTKVGMKNALAYIQTELKDEYAYEEKETVDKTGWLTGVVYNADNVPQQGATVSIKNTFTTVQTDADGRYYIDAQPDEILTVKAFGMYPKDTLVGPLKTLHVPLATNRELLDEVYLEKNISKTISDEKVSTPFGTKKRGSVGYSLNQTITSDQIAQTTTELSQILNWGRGLEAVPQDEGRSYYKYRFRKYKYASFRLDTYAAFVVDGIVYDQNIPNTRVPEIHPQLIAKIILLQPASATVRYGSAAAFGAIVIETKQYQELTQETSENDSEDTNTALITGNDYSENLETIEIAENKTKSPWYIETLQKANSFQEAKKLFYDLRTKVVGTTLPFYVETSDYFEKWDTRYAASIRSNIAVLASQNTKALRALAYQNEANNELKTAQYLYEHIVNLAPEEAQSYLDLATVYRQSGAIEQAYTLLVQLFYNGIANVNATEIQDQVVNELRHIIANHKSKVDFKLLPEELLSLGFEKDIRLVFNWNDSATDFELQFVSPENKFFTFQHTAFANRPMLEKELKDGYASAEFILEDVSPGRWLINVKNFGPDDEKNPTYLKYTIYKNYGLSNESKEVKVLNLSKYSEKITLDSFTL